MAGQYKDPRAAELLRRYHERFADAELPVPVGAIAEDLLGLAVGERDDIAVSGLLLPDERAIWLNSSESTARRRFTLAHELGHWVCQCLEGRTAPIYCRPVDLGEAADRTLEREANVFAAELVMPEPVLREEFPRAAGLTDLADRFGVSAEAMSWRLYNLQLSEERPA